MKQTRGRRVQAKKYIDKVIQESCASEKRENDVEYDILIVDDDLLFAIKSKYQRVRRRIYYRLRNNLYKNFGLHFHLVMPSSSAEDYDSFMACKYIIYDKISPNHTFMFWDLFGKKYAVASVYGIRPEDELGICHLTVMKSQGYDYCEDHDTENWKKYIDAYKAAYGEEPIEGHRKAKAHYKLVNVHRERYNKDEEEHGCGYWSVCSDRSCPCSPTAPSQQGFNEKIWQNFLEEQKVLEGEIYGEDR
ncbi:MAG: hypothetical protein NC548_12830 [Lachnospiraceae bacterium]|nr:hypothetical protein [Lachnospiraceae bacterium]MCM1230725.1 hypothetical protein [Ruminococcus flavefaciens]